MEHSWACKTEFHGRKKGKKGRKVPPDNPSPVISLSSGKMKQEGEKFWLPLRSAGGKGSRAAFIKPFQFCPGGGVWEKRGGAVNRSCNKKKRKELDLNFGLRSMRKGAHGSRRIYEN